MHSHNKQRLLKTIGFYASSSVATLKSSLLFINFQTIFFVLVSYSVLPLTQMLYLYPLRVSPAVRIEFPQAVALNLQPCFFLFISV